MTVRIRRQALWVVKSNRRRYNRMPLRAFEVMFRIRYYHTNHYWKQLDLANKYTHEWRVEDRKIAVRAHREPNREFLRRWTR